MEFNTLSELLQVECYQRRNGEWSCPTGTIESSNWSSKGDMLIDGGCQSLVVMKTEKY